MKKTVLKKLYYHLFSSNKYIKRSIKKSNENEEHCNTIDKRRKRKPKVKVGELLRTFLILKTFYKGDTTKWSFDLRTKTRIKDNTISSYILNFFPETNIEVLLKKASLTITQ